MMHSTAPRRNISVAAAAAIAARTDEARGHIFIEIFEVLRSRGSVTAEQLKCAASVLSYLVQHDEIEPDFVACVTRKMPPAVTQAALDWMLTPDWREIVERARQAAAGRQRAWKPSDSDTPRLVDPRRHYSITTIVDTFGIDDAEAEQLGLTRLVTERRRSALRRAAERAPEPPQTAVQDEKPWESAGLSRAAWYRRQRRSQPFVAPRQTDAEPWKAEGISRATWYRRQQISAGETKGEIPADRIKGWDIPPDLEPEYLDSFYIDKVGQSLIPSLTIPPASAFPTAETRRLRAVALRLGLEFDHRDYLSWSIPDGRVLTEAEQAEFDAAGGAAVRSLERLERIEFARARERERRQPPQPAPPRRTHDEALAAGERPGQVSEAAWDKVPPFLRTCPRVELQTARLFVTGVPADDAMRLSVYAARRALAVAQRLRIVRPDIDADDADALGWWHCDEPTAEAVPAALQTFERWQEADRREEARELRARELVTAEAERQAVPEKDRQAVIDSAVPDIAFKLKHESAISDDTVRHHVKLAREVLDIQRRERIAAELGLT